MKVKMIMKGIYESIDDFESEINKYIELAEDHNIVDIKYQVSDRHHFAMIIVK